MIITETFEPRSRQDWRKWLGLHHAESKAIWVVFLKKHTGRAALTYQDALEEALCFGWIDGVRKRIDDLRFAQRFTPRTKSSRWSETNRALAADLEARGLMTPAGLAARGSTPPDPPPAGEQTSGVPEWLAGALRASPLAWKNFNALPPSHQRRYVGWISSAKRDETRDKRVAKAIALLEENKRIGLGPGEVRK